MHDKAYKYMPKLNQIATMITKKETFIVKWVQLSKNMFLSVADGRSWHFSTKYRKLE